MLLGYKIVTVIIDISGTKVRYLRYKNVLLENIIKNSQENIFKRKV